MEIEVMTPSPAPEFNFDSATTSPFITAPSTPSFFTTPFSHDDFDIDFDFDFSGALHRPSISHADDLFSNGQIKPLKPPPRVNYGTIDSPKLPKSPGRSLIDALSPKFKKRNVDPFEEAIKQSTKQGNFREGRRERKSGGRTRSLSPFRVSDILSEIDSDSPNSKAEKQSTLFSFPKNAWKRYKNWKLKDLLLFRSASEGRKEEIRHNPLKNYSSIHKHLEEDVKNSSFRSTDSSGSVAGSGSGSGLRRKGSLSVHYEVNRAVQEEMKKKTPLPYKHGLMGMGCLGFEPVVHDLAKSFGSSRG